MNPPSTAWRRARRRLKESLRRRVPLWLWSAAGDRARAASHLLSVAAASAAAALLKAFPDRFRIILRDELSLRVPLDHDRVQVLMHVTSRTELELRVRACAKEPETVEWILRTFQPGDVLYDIGANVGAYSLLAAAGAHCRVHAFEPVHRTYHNLVENILLNGLEGAVVLHQVILGKKTGLVRFHYSTTEAGGARHGGIRGEGQAAGAGGVMTMASYRLDDFVDALGLEPPTHLKIDTDGSELEVLEGAVKTLRSPSLRSILVEVDAQEGHPAEVRALLAGGGFNLVGDHPRAGGEARNLIFERNA